MNVSADGSDAFYSTIESTLGLEKQNENAPHTGTTFVVSNDNLNITVPQDKTTIRGMNILPSANGISYTSPDDSYVGMDLFGMSRAVGNDLRLNGRGMIRNSTLLSVLIAQVKQ